MTTQPTRDQLRALVDAATEGPWELIGGGEYVTGVSILVAPDDGGVRSVDAEFIAAARTAIPQLLDQLEQAEAERDTYRAKMDELDRAYLSEHGQRKRIEEQVRAVRDAAPTIPAGNDDHAWQIMTDLDAGTMFAWENVLDILDGG